MSTESDRPFEPINDSDTNHTGSFVGSEED